jgi:hypothetical protein
MIVMFCVSRVQSHAVARLPAGDILDPENRAGNIFVGAKAYTAFTRHGHMKTTTTIWGLKNGSYKWNI